MNMLYTTLGGSWAQRKKSLCQAFRPVWVVDIKKSDRSECSTSKFHIDLSVLKKIEEALFYRPVWMFAIEHSHFLCDFEPTNWMLSQELESDCSAMRVRIRNLELFYSQLKGEYNLTKLHMSSYSVKCHFRENKSGYFRWPILQPQKLC